LSSIGTDKLDASAFTAAAVLSLLLGVDGSGSGLDADKLGGIESSKYLNTTEGFDCGEIS
jgi:hypothetical protein